MKATIIVLVFGIVPFLGFTQLDHSHQLETQLQTHVATDQLLLEIEVEWGEEFDRVMVGRIINVQKSKFIRNYRESGASDNEVLEFREEIVARILEKLPNLILKGHDHSHDHDHLNDLRILNGPCVNMDFEGCDFSGWDMTEGDVDGTPFNYINVTPTTSWSTYSGGSASDQHYIVNGGTDPTVGIPMVNPAGGTCSAVIGDFTGTGYRAASISQPFLVDANNANFTYSYAVVLQDPSHSVGEQPFFRIRMYDELGGSIACAEFEVYAADGHPDWQISGTTNYIDWQTAFIPLQAYIGQNVTIEFTVGDCGQGGHYGYAYVDASCAPMEIIPSDTIVCSGVPVTLSAPAGGASYSWSNGATTQNISVSTAGVYSVDIMAVSGCVITLDVEVFQGDEPTADFTATSVCVGTQTDFTDLSTSPNGVSSWAWDFDGNGTVDATTTNGTYTYPSAGTYAANLLVTDASGCMHDTTINVTVEEQPTADFVATTVCEGTVTNYTDQSTTTGGTITYEWDFDSNGSIDATTQNPSYGFATAGTYNTTLMVTAPGGCSDVVTYPVIVNPVPVIDFAINDVCHGSTTNFTNLSTVSSGSITSTQWDFGDGSTSTANSPSYVYPNPGTYNVSLSITTDNGCIAFLTLPAVVSPMPVVNFTSTDPDGCSVWCVDFTDSSTISSGSIDGYLWDLGDGTVSTAQNPQHCYENTTQSPLSYDVSLTVTSDMGCISDSTAYSYVTVFPIPTAAFDFAPTELNEYNSTVYFIDQSIGANGYSWDFGDGNSASIINPEHTYSGAGVYNVTLYVSNIYGCTDEVTHPIEVKPEYGIYVPNAFTPNGDGFNDFFFAKGFNIIQFELLIYDRWGNLIYQAEDMNRPWDGTRHGDLVQEDVYVWKVNCTDIHNEQHELYGHVTVVR